MCPRAFSYFLWRRYYQVYAPDVPSPLTAPFQPFKDEFKALTARLARADFEVSIAVSVPAPGPSPEPSTDDERDAFFGAHGFEYVNGHSPPTADHATAPTEGPSHPHRVPAPNPEHEGVPGISRIADALSTILWPSMVRRAAPQRLLPPDNDNDGDGDGLLSLLRRREMIALERWLEQGANDDEDDEDGPDPWAGALRSSEPQAASGFDDNFSDFVSAGADPALPSRADVAAVSRRIFDAGGCAEDADADADADADGGCAQAPFDLSRVLGALEAMKEEIAGIADEDEKRRAAAKVALGLVYGLEEG